MGRSFLVLAGVALAGCTTANPLFCDQNTPCSADRPFCDLQTNTCVAGECAASDDCPAAQPICDTSSNLCTTCTVDDECAAIDSSLAFCGDEGACVACKQTSDCPATAPICESQACVACEDGAVGDTACLARDENAPICDTGVCRSCADHSECPSLACEKATGRCAGEDEAIYVDVESGTDAGACGTRSSPCATIDGIDGAVPKLTGARPFIVLAAGTYSETVGFTNATALVVGPSQAKIVPAAIVNTPAVLVEGSSDVTIDGITLSDAAGTSGGDGLRCQVLVGNPTVTVRDAFILDNAGIGIDASDCTVVVRASTISGNLAGGLSFNNSEFDVENSFIVSNGAAGSVFGGVLISNGTITMQRLDHNTIARNDSLDTARANGVDCGVGNAVSARNNIIYEGLSSTTAVDGNCDHDFSDIENGPTNGGNIDVDPQFENSVGGNFHLKDGSECEDAADPNSTVTVDIDGNARPSGDGFDIGADEIPR